MLRITQQNSAAGAKKYFSAADYLSEQHELSGVYGGEGAKKLGLAGLVVDKDSFDRLCDNLDPRDGKQLTVRTRADRTVGYDFTFSVPKAVSVRYALTGDERIFDAFREAVDETMREDAEPLMKTRVRKGGRDEERTTSNMIYARFCHKTARPVDGIPDPHLHEHVYVFNATEDTQERQWKAGQFRELKASGPLLQALFRVRLANKLQDLGVPIVRQRDDFEIRGMSPEMLKRFSRRTTLIEAKAEKDGITDPEKKGELGRKTREEKNYVMSWDKLRESWNGRMTPAERQAATRVYRAGESAGRMFGQEKAAVDYALEHCQANEAAIPERKVLTEALKRGLGSVTIEDVKRELARRPLIRATVNGVMTVATPEMKRAEMAVVRFGRDGRGRYRPLGDPNRAWNRDWLNDGQKSAIRHALGSRDRITLIRGPQGVGKTKMEAELREALVEAGRPVVALAQSTSAVEVLRDEANFADATTVARFLKDTKLQATARGGLVLLDEGSLVGTNDMLKLFGVCEQIGARAIIVGDTRQNRSVAAGEPLRLLETRAGLPVAEITEIIRQKGDYLKPAKLLNDGQISEGFKALDALGWIKEIPDDERYQAMAQAYLDTVSERKKGGECKTALAVCAMWAEAKLVTDAIREELKTRDKSGVQKRKDNEPPEKMLGEERRFDIWVPVHLSDAQKGDDAGWIEPGDLLRFHQNAPGYKNGARVIVTEDIKIPVQAAEHFEVFRPATLEVAVGDRIRYTARGKTKDGENTLSNGGLATVRGFTARGDLIVDKGLVISKDWGHIAHGYAVSSENSQGRTVDRVLIGVSSQSFGAANERRSYVAWTRGREQAIAFTDNKAELLKAVQRHDRPISAIELDDARRRHRDLSRRRSLRQRLGQHVLRLRRFAAMQYARAKQLTRTLEPMQQGRSHGR